MVVLNSTDVIREALVKKWSDFAGRPASYTGMIIYFTRILSIKTGYDLDCFCTWLVSAGIVSAGGRTISLGDYTEEWRAHRRLVHNALQHCCQQSLHAVIERQALQLKKVQKIQSRQWDKMLSSKWLQSLDTGYIGNIKRHIIFILCVCRFWRTIRARL